MEPMYPRVCMKRSLTCTHNCSPRMPVQQAKHVQIIRCLGIVSIRTQATRCSTRIIAIVAIVIAVIAPCYHRRGRFCTHCWCGPTHSLAEYHSTIFCEDVSNRGRKKLKGEDKTA